jgi:hypothetical protein
MNAEPIKPAARSKAGKLVLQLVMGMVSGAGAMMAALYLLEQQDGLLEEPGRLLALGTAVVFTLIAVLITVSMAAPSFGEKALNVEDAAEIGEQKRPLMVGSLSFLLMALLLAALALVPGEQTEGVISREAGAILAGAAFAALVALSVRFRKMGDELNQAVAKEANGWTLIFVLLLFGGWGMLAQLGYAPMFAPLTFVAGLLALYLLGIFVAAGIRGMLKPR